VWLRVMVIGRPLHDRRNVSTCSRQTIGLAGCSVKGLHRTAGSHHD
jgi:hypothetical protein